MVLYEHSFSSSLLHCKLKQPYVVCQNKRYNICLNYLFYCENALLMKIHDFYKKYLLMILDIYKSDLDYHKSLITLDH